MSDQRLERLKQWIREEIQNLQAYEAEPAGPEIRLDANESPYDMPLELKRKILDGFYQRPWNRYPDPHCLTLREELARQDGLRPDQIVVGNGSDEIIRDLLTVYAGAGTGVVFPTPTFGMYRLLTQAAGARPVEVPLGPDWQLDVEGVLSALSDESTRLLFLARPNNPTGNLFPLEQIERILKGTERLVVVDEAYRLFAGETLLPKLAEYPNLAILNTFSKAMSLAGLRVGYLSAHPDVIKAVNRVRLPYNLDSFAQWGATLAASHPAVWQAQARRIIDEREKTMEALRRLPGVHVFPSRANFILIRLNQAGRVKTDVAAAGLAIRGFHEPENLRDCLRITVGTPEENQLLLATLQHTLHV